MAKQRYNDEYEYEIFDDGYEIYGKTVTMSQHEPYARPYDRYKSYEENCILQIEDMMNQPEPDPSTDSEKLRADLDYMSLMLDVPLPSEEEEGE